MISGGYMDNQKEGKPLCTYIHSAGGEAYAVVQSMDYEKMIPMYVNAGLEIDVQKVRLDNLLMCLELISGEGKLVGGVHRIIHQSGSMGGCAEDCKQQEDEQECQKYPANHFSCYFPR